MNVKTRLMRRIDRNKSELPWLTGCQADQLNRIDQFEQIGLIFLAWQGRAKDSVADRWMREAQGLLQKIDSIAEPLLGLRWLKQDLYLYFQLPVLQELDHEHWLLELASRLKQKLEQEWSDVISELPEQLRLHVGATVMVKDENGFDSYEGIKQVLLHAQTADSIEHSLKRRMFDSILRERNLYPVYQPIFALQDQSTFGYESLARCPENLWFDGPMALFSFAEKEGVVYPLDRLAREKALESCRPLKRGQKLFINIMASIMNDPQFTSGLTLSLLKHYGLSPQNVVFEITERTSIEDFSMVKKVLSHYRNQGYQIAIDDAGAGYSSLQSIVELRPDYIKVDRSIVHNVHCDEMKQHILGTFVQLADKMGIGVIAEGIELQEELDQVKAMGIPYAQGYLLGRPSASF